MKPEWLREKENPGSAHWTGLNDESPVSVTVTHRAVSATLNVQSPALDMYYKIIASKPTLDNDVLSLHPCWFQVSCIANCSLTKKEFKYQLYKDIAQHIHSPRVLLSP